MSPKPVSGRTLAEGFASARAAVIREDFSAAAETYLDLLDEALTPDLRAEAQNNLASALCMLARSRPDARRLLDQAAMLLNEALRWRSLERAPKEWATSRTNLVVVLMKLFEATGEDRHLLSANLTAQGVENVLQRAGDADLQAWFVAVHSQLGGLRKRP